MHNVKSSISVWVVLLKITTESKTTWNGANKNKETVEVLTALMLRIQDFWFILSSRVINSCHFEGRYCLHLQELSSPFRTLGLSYLA